MGPACHLMEPGQWADEVRKKRPGGVPAGLDAALLHPPRLERCDGLGRVKHVRSFTSDRSVQCKADLGLMMGI